ncbi:MAG: SpoIIE family protein phosphatase [Gemmataceae bacterium]|nr:SpoIIE family protein phosphatase [Gemmataceae bacterium]
MTWSSFIPASVGLRVALAVNLLVVVAGVGFLVFDYHRESRQRLADKSLALREQAMTLHQAVSGLDRKAVAQQQRFIDAVCGRMSDDESPGHHIVVEIDGRALQSQAHHRDSDELLEAIRAAAGDPDGGLLVGKHSEGGVTAYVAEEMANVRAEIRRQAVLRSVGVVVFGLLLAVAISLVIHKLVHKPLRRLVKTIDGIAAGNYGTTAGGFDGAELARLAEAVNAMSGSLAQAEARRKIALGRARRVQANLLPRDGQAGGLDVAFFHRAADEVGGDFLDIFQTKAGTTVLCMADVVGHGIAPAMIAAMLKVLLLDAAEVHDDPGDMLRLLNSRFTAVNLPEDFATVFLAVWRPAARTLSYASAGHEPALLLAKGSEPELLHSTGMMMGIDPMMAWASRAIQVAPGAILACWTDGVTEGRGATDEQFGKDALISLVEQGVGAGPRAVAEEVERAVREHARDGPMADDCTFLAVRFP